MKLSGKATAVFSPLSFLASVSCRLSLAFLGFHFYPQI